MRAAGRFFLRLGAAVGFVVAVAGAPVLTLAMVGVLWVLMRLERPE